MEILKFGSICLRNGNQKVKGEPSKRQIFSIVTSSKIDVIDFIGAFPYRLFRQQPVKSEVLVKLEAAPQIDLGTQPPVGDVDLLRRSLDGLSHRGHVLLQQQQVQLERQRRQQPRGRRRPH